MATLPAHPEKGRAYRLDPGDPTEVIYDPGDEDDGAPWYVRRPDGTREWCSDAEVEAIPGGPLTPVEAER